MKNRICAILLIAVMILGLAACGVKDKDTGKSASGDHQNGKQAGDAGSHQEADTSLQYIKDRGKLILGLDDSFPPMGFRDDADKIVGFDIDLATAVADKLGVELVLQPIEWDAKEQELKTMNIDCIWNGFSITPERQEKLTLSMPYMENSIALVVVDDGGINNKADMAGKRLALQSGSSAEESLNSDENKEFRDTVKEVNGFADYVTALMDLETKNSDAVLMDSVVANYMIQVGNKNFKILDEHLVAEEYAIGFRKGEEELCKAVNDALTELKAEGTLAEISEKWFGSDITLVK